jgi:LTXXQ motif family protein
VKTLTILSAVAALAVMGASPVVAQRGGRGMPGMPGMPGMAGPGPGAMGMARPSGAEMALQMRERLKLTEPQINQLNQIRVESLQRRQQQMSEVMEVQSRFRAGEATGDAVRQVMESQREARQQAVQAEHDRVTGVLTEEQQEVFARAADERQQMGRRGRGFGGARGFRRGWR